MGQTRCKINKYASIIYRLAQTFFDRELGPCRIGCGQQFFLLRIYEHPGISVLELARKGYFDKGTTNRAVKKLLEEEYVRLAPDEKDKRIHRLYVTEKAQPVIHSICAVLIRWTDVLTQGMSEEEKAYVEQMMGKMAENAYAYMRIYRERA